MFCNARVSVIIPTLNEEQAIGHVLRDIPDWVDQVVVADNGSTDETVAIATSMNADIAVSLTRGYGAACQAGITMLQPCDILVFLDGDFSDFPDQMSRLVRPIVENKADFVIGSRKLGQCEKGAMTVPQRFGNWLACYLIWLILHMRYTDLGPFRAIKYNVFKELGMRDQSFGWTVEMQIKAIFHKLKIQEVAVDYRVRQGYSKISGTVMGTIFAGYGILKIIIITAFIQR